VRARPRLEIPLPRWAPVPKFVHAAQWPTCGLKYQVSDIPLQGRRRVLSSCCHSVSSSSVLLVIGYIPLRISQSRCSYELPSTFSLCCDKYLVDFPWETLSQAPRQSWTNCMLRFLIFHICFRKAQTCKIHISLYEAPKLVRQILLCSPFPVLYFRGLGHDSASIGFAPILL